MSATYSPTKVRNPGSRPTASSPDFFSGNSLIQHEINSLPPIFSLEEERLRKHLYLNELFTSLEKGGKGGSVKAIIADTYLIADRLSKLALYSERHPNIDLEKVAKLFEDDYEFIEDSSITILQEVLVSSMKIPETLRAEFLKTVSDQIFFALDPESTEEKYPRNSITKKHKLFDATNDATATILFSYYQRINDAIDQEKLDNYMKEVARKLDYYVDEFGNERLRGINVVAIGGSINAGKGTTCDLLGLEVAQSGTEGAIGRGGNTVSVEIPDQKVPVALPRTDLVAMDEKFRDLSEAERNADPDYILYKAAMQKITWYDRYELFMRGFDRSRFKNVQTPNKVVTVVFGDVMAEVRTRLDKQGKFKVPIALDGAPRNDKQAEELLGHLNKDQLGVLFYQNIKEETSAIRSLGRAVATFAKRGEFREDELVGFNFDLAPGLAKFFEMENGALTTAARTSIERVIAHAQAKNMSVDLYVQDVIRRYLKEHGETLALVKLVNKKDKTDEKGRTASRYWIYLDWKESFISACEKLGMKAFQVDCDELPREEVARIAGQYMGLIK